MDNCFIDISIEFLSVAFHNILYYAAVYPRSIFEPRKKYSTVVYHSIHPEVNQYIDLCLKSVRECLRNGQLCRVEFRVTDSNYIPVIKFIFDFHKNHSYDEVADAYLIQAEQNLRAFCLNLSSISHKIESLSEDCSFTIHVHTSESSSVAIATNPDLEDFPLVEVENVNRGKEKIIPIRRFDIRSYSVDTYVEIKTT